MTDDSDRFIPPRPQPPAPEDCCGSGCIPCVYDLYEEALADWEEKREMIRGDKNTLKTDSGDTNKTANPQAHGGENRE